VIAAVHLDPRLTVPLAAAVAAALVWYWIRLGRPGVPRARRRVRRLSVAAMLVSLPNFVRGLSWLDPEVDRAAYVVSWSLSMMIVLLVFFSGCLDLLVTLRLNRRQWRTEVEDGGADVIRAVRRRAEDGEA
jgi:hypothetical protein